MKLLHCADIHLDSVMESNLSPERAKERKRELLAGFAAMVQYGAEHDVRGVLIAGDLFDGRNVKRETVEMVREEFAKSCGTRIFISPGNHDPYTDGSVWKSAEFTSNVVVFRDTALSHVTVRMSSQSPAVVSCSGVR